MTAHIYPKGKTWYVYLYYTEKSEENNTGTNSSKKKGKKHQKWFNTHLPLRGNTRRADKMKEELLAYWKPILEPDDYIDGKVIPLPDSPLDILPQIATQQMPDNNKQINGLSMYQNITLNEESVLFADMLLEWLDREVRIRLQKTTYQNYRTVVKGMIEPYFRRKGLFVHHVTPDVIEDYQEYLEDLGRSGNTIKHHTCYISGALKYGVKKQIIRYNPAAMANKPRIERNRTIPYSYNELDLLFRSIAQDPLWLVVVLGAYLGMRRGEIIGLEWDAVDFDNRIIHVRQSAYLELDEDGRLIGQRIKNDLKSKSGYRSINFDEKVAFVLQLAQERYEQKQIDYGSKYITRYSNFVCLKDNGDWIKIDYVTDHFSSHLEKYGLRRIRFHDLRHTCATMLYNNDIDLKKLKDLLGHADIRTTEQYTHFDFSLNKQVAEKIEEIMPSLRV